MHVGAVDVEAGDSSFSVVLVFSPFWLCHFPNTVKYGVLESIAFAILVFVCGVFLDNMKPFRVGYAVAQLVETLRYKPEGRGFDSRWCHWNFSLT